MKEATKKIKQVEVEVLIEKALGNQQLDSQEGIIRMRALECGLSEQDVNSMIAAAKKKVSKNRNIMEPLKKHRIAICAGFFLIVLVEWCVLRWVPHTPAPRLGIILTLLVNALSLIAYSGIIAIVYVWKNKLKNCKGSRRKSITE